MIIAPTWVVSALLLHGCDREPMPPSAPVDGGDTTDAPYVPPPAETTGTDTSEATAATDASTGDPPEPLRLQVVYLGVGGIAMTYDDRRVLSAPLYTNPDLLDVTLGSIASDPALVDLFLPMEHSAGATAMIVGHAHYDHLLDVPTVQDRVGGSRVFANRSAKWLLPAHLDVVAVNDPAAPVVDRRMCADPDPCTGAAADEAGAWIDASPGLRLRALCSSHPAQFLGLIHFGEGCVTEDHATPPTSAADWLEGATLTWLVDFLDADGTTVFRVYYQDAPTSAPVGLVHPDLLAEHAIDVAVLNVGNYDVVHDHPTEAIEALAPRYVLGIHWEDFFQTQAEPIEPIPFHAPPETFDKLALSALAGGDEAPVIVDGEATHGRYWRPMPGAAFSFAPAALR